MPQAKMTWRPNTEHGKQSTQKQNDMQESIYAFPKQRKEPLTDAAHVRTAMARFDQVKGVSDDDRDLAWRNIQAAAKHYGVEVEEQNWHDLGHKPQSKNPVH